MKKLFRITTALSILAIVGYWIYDSIARYQGEKAHQEWVATLDNTASKNVHILTDTILVDYLDEKRTLAVYLPDNYAQDSLNYPVIYFMDGESLFDQKIQEGMEWQVDEVIDSLGKIGGTKSIVVGIYSSDDRMKEYKPFPSDRWYSDWTVSGDKHADWIAKTVKPWVDKRYRTRKEPDATVIAGASLGGLMSYYMVMTYPDIFGRAIVFSPSFWVNEKVYTLHEKNPNLAQQKIYFDAGELETPTVESVQKMEAILLKSGMPKANIKTDIEAGTGHWHMTWKQGFKKAYPWIVE